LIENLNKMPVQINEIIIRTVVDSPAASGSSATAVGCGPTNGTGGGGEGAGTNELAEKILEIIKEKQER
jgi:hypothetical protein